MMLVQVFVLTVDCVNFGDNVPAGECRDEVMDSLPPAGMLEHLSSGHGPVPDQLPICVLGHVAPEGFGRGDLIPKQGLFAELLSKKKADLIFRVSRSSVQEWSLKF